MQRLSWNGGMKARCLKRKSLLQSDESRADGLLARTRKSRLDLLLTFVTSPSSQGGTTALGMLDFDALSRCRHSRA